MLLKFLRSPATIFGGVFLGIICGIYIPDVILPLNKLNNVYISLFTVTTLPLIICTIVINMRKLFADKGVIRVLMVFLLILISSTFVIGIFLSSVCKPMLKMSDDAMVALTKESMPNVSEQFIPVKVHSKNNIENSATMSLVDFFTQIVPDNIFEALAHNRVLQIVVMCMVFGGILAFVEEEFSSPIVELLEGMRQVLLLILNVVMVALPISLFILMANTFADDSTTKMFSVFVSFIGLMIAGILILLFVAFLIIWKNTKHSLWSQVKIFKQTFITAFITCSDIPTTVVGVEGGKDLGLDQRTLESVLPVSVFLAPCGRILWSLMTVMYATILYDLELNFNVLVFIIISTLFFSLSISSISMPSRLPILGIMLDPLGLPTSIMITVYMLSSLIIDSMSTFCDIYVNVAIVTLVDKKIKKREVKAILA